MHSFVPKTCIALTWDAEHNCRGVKMVRHGERFAIVAHWQSKHGIDSEPSVALTKGAHALGADGNTPIVAGSDSCDFGFADLTMPDLDRENLRNALRFELNKHAPVSEDKLAWGFRVLGPAEGDRLKVRIGYMPETQWRRWLDIVSGLSHSVDSVIPAPAALDPVLSDQALYMETQEGNGYLFAPADEGREVLASDGTDETAFGAGESPLNDEHLDCGDMNTLPVAEQRRFAGTVVLAMYGATPDLRADKKTWFALPEELQPRRHRASRRLAAALAIYIGLILLIVFGRNYLEGVRYMNNLHSAQEDVRRQLVDLIEQEDPEQFVSALSDELTGLDLTRPTMLQCLIVLTEQIPEQYWASNMNWTDGRIELQVRSQQDDLGFLDSLRDSPLLTDVVPTRKSVDHNNEMTLQVQMRATSGVPLMRTASRSDERAGEATE